MFGFLKKQRQTVVVNCYTSDPQVFSYARIEKAAKKFPSWWKNLPLDGDDPNMRNCYGFVAQHAKSFVLPMWSDLDVEVGSDGGYGWRFNDMRSKAVSHLGQQYHGWVDSSSTVHIKLEAPWRFVCSEEVHFQWSDAMWGRPNVFDYYSPPAIVEYKYQAGTAVNLIFNTANRPKKFFIPHGQPLVYITPLTERPVEFRCHLVSEEVFSGVAPIFPAVKKRAYLMYKDAKKREAPARCPFSTLTRGGEL